MSTLIKINDKPNFVEVYHLICKASEEFYRVSINVPKNLLEVTQHIHGRFDNALYNVFKCANTFDVKLKFLCLSEAKKDIFFQYSSFEYLEKTHSITIGQANNCLSVLRDVYEQLCKWYSAILKEVRSSKE